MKQIRWLWFVVALIGFWTFSGPELKAAISSAACFPGIGCLISNATNVCIDTNKNGIPCETGEPNLMTPGPTWFNSTDIYTPIAGATTLNLTGTDCSPALVTNRLSTTTLRINLCEATPGAVVWVVWENAALTINIEPDGTAGGGACDRIGTPEVMADGNGLTWTATGTVGSAIQLMSLQNNEWRVMYVKGAAPTDNGSGCGG